MVITNSSTKGGVGKSTLSILMTTNLAARGFRVLFIDYDVFNNSGTMYFTLGIENIEDLCEQKNIFEALSHRMTEGYIIRSRVKNVDIIPSSLKLCDIRTIDTHILKKIIPADRYDYVIIDTSPTYDNHTISALYAADYIFTPLGFTFYDVTTARFLRSKLYDELPDHVGKWYLLYSRWEEHLAPFENSLQSQFVRVFESTFDNILNIKIPKTPLVDKYTQTDERLSVHSHIIGARRLAVAINDLVNLITGDTEHIAEKF